MRYSPDGKVWASGGFDGKMFLYEGKDNELIGEFKDGDNNAHSGGVYGLSFSPKGDKVLSASGDKTCKIFDVETRACVATYTTGSDIMDQQLGCLWSKNHLISVSLSGNIHFLDERTPGSITMTVYGHNKPITALARGGDEERCKTLFTGDSEGRVIAWQTEQGVGNRLRGPGPANQVNGLAAEPDGSVVAVGIDDTLRRAAADGEFTSLAAKLGAQPRAVRFCGESAGAATAVATVKSLLLLDGDGNVLRERSLPFEPSSLAYCEQSRHLAVGDSSEAGAILVVSADNLDDEVKTAKATGAVTSLSYSPDGRYLAAGDANRRVVLLDASTYEKAHAKEWGFHSARVTCVAWSPDSKYLASGGLDCAVILWSVDQPAKHHVLLGAHVQSQITGVAWMDPVTVASTGQDGNVKIWNVTWKV